MVNGVTFDLKYTFIHAREDTIMSRYELENLETERRCDQIIEEIERKDPNVLHSVVPGSRLHQIIHNPVTEGIDEG